MDGGKKTVSYYVKGIAAEPFLTSSIELQYNTNVSVAQVCAQFYFISIDNTQGLNKQFSTDKY